MNLESLVAAISEKEACTKRKNKCLKLIKQEQDIVSKIGAGKFTWQTLLKSQDQKIQYQSQLLGRIEKRKADVKNWDIIKKFLIIYLAEVAIPYFKGQKDEKYIQAMQQYSHGEMTNAEKHISCWGDFTDLAEAYMKRVHQEEGIDKRNMERQQKEELIQDMISPK